MVPTIRPAWFYHTFAIATATIWSFSYIHIVWLAEYVSPLQLTVVRNYFSIPLLIVLWLVVRPRVRGYSIGQWALIIAIGCASGPVYHFPLSWGGSAGRTEASLIGLIIATVPVHVGWLAWIVLGEKLSWRKIAGLALGLGGVFIVLTGRFGGVDLVPANVVGPLAVTLAAMIAAMNTVLTRKARTVIRPLELVCLSGAIASIICIALAPAANLGELRTMPAFGWWAAFYLGFMAISIAYMCWFTALSGGIPAAGIAMYLFIPAVLSALWSWLWQDNEIGPLFFVGAVMVLGGIVIGEQNRKKNGNRDTAN